MKELSVEVLTLNKGEVESVITQKDVLDAVELAFKTDGEGQLVQPPKEAMWIDDNKLNFMIAMPAYLKTTNVAGAKWGSLYWDQQPGIPACGAIIILNDPKTGMPYAIMDGLAITNLRTGGGHAVIAAKYLAKKDSKVLAIIGCGAEARVALPVFADIFSLEVAKIFDINPEAMTAFKEEMAEQVPVKVQPMASIQEAVDGTDIILMVTSAQEPIVFDSWVPQGCLVAGLYAFFDLDPELSKRADKWVIGSRISDGHRIVERTEFGKKTIKLSWDDVYADMGEIVTGRVPGRENDRERIIYTHLGMGAHDVALAKIAYDKAKKGGVGTMVKIM
jgi:ornithine cyclodeaminase/alanine dehydrogenase-like protein (mu-crystallin family)